MSGKSNPLTTSALRSVERIREILRQIVFHLEASFFFSALIGWQFYYTTASAAVTRARQVWFISFLIPVRLRRGREKKITISNFNLPHPPLEGGLKRPPSKGGF